MSKLVFDIEANGLLDTVDTVWCMVIKNIDSKDRFIFDCVSDNLHSSNWIDIFLGNTIIGHNIISYDIPLLRKMYGIDLVELLGNESIIDTYSYSQVLFPDRPMPKGCPTSLLNPVTNKSKSVGPHGLESWAWRVGERKLAIHDWTTFTPEIIERCKGDVDINEKVYYALVKEAGLLP